VLVLRLIFGSLMIAACVGLVWLDAWLSQQPAPAAWPAPSVNVLGLIWQGGPIVLAVTALVVLGAVELGRLLDRGGYRPITWWAAAMAGLVAVAPWLMPGCFGTDSWSPLGVVLAVGLLGAFLAVMGSGRIEGGAASVATTFLIMGYTGLLASFVVRIRVDLPGVAGAWAVMYFIGVVKVTDIAAYFVGSAVGRHKLVPRLSPGKTVEGLVGGVLAAAGASVVLAWMGGIIVPSGVGGWRLGSGEALVFGVVMALAGQLGDLAESLIKRDVAQKDSGRAVPGFGGILDLVDSPLLAAPLAWWMLHRAWSIAGASGGP